MSTATTPVRWRNGFEPRACNMGWTRLTHFWTSATPKRCKRFVFLANVASRAWSGLEALALTRAETARIDASLAKQQKTFD
eukprot:8987265-Pyramimonas_sp.AAC.1